MPALAAAAENPAPPHDAAVTAAGFRRTGVQGAKCVHDIVECDRPASFSRRAALPAGTQLRKQQMSMTPGFARFSFSVKSRSLTPSAGCENACAG